MCAMPGLYNTKNTVDFAEFSTNTYKLQGLNMKNNLLLMGLVALLAMTGCAKHKTTPKTPPVETTLKAPLNAAIEDIWRGRQADRDVFRHPEQTLKFFGLAPDQTLIEVFPGGGWYTGILAPYAKATNGHYMAAVFDERMGERYKKANQRFTTKFSDENKFGSIKTIPFGPNSGPLCDNCADLIVTFRNIHSFMGRDYADKAFADFYQALKPGGVLGVVEHRLPETREQNPKAPTGYVQESYVKDLAKRAGFEFVGASDINANPNDTADHPFGVWTLPPTSRKPRRGDLKASEFDAAKYKAIGESDRFTLKFRKPINTSDD